MSKEVIQNKWEHLKESSIEMSNLNISLIVGADMSHQHISLDLSSEDKNDQIGVLSKLSWVIMKGKSIVHRTVSSNSIISSRNSLESTVQLFWEVDSYGTVAKSDPSLLLQNERYFGINMHNTVGLLLKEDKPHLPNNRHISILRMKCIENKFKKDPTLALNIKKPSKIIQTKDINI